MRNCGQDMLPKMQPGFAIGNVAGIRPQNDDRDSPQGLVKCSEQEGKTTAKDTVTSPEKERVIPHQKVKNHMLTCQHTQSLSLTWNEVL